MSELQITGTKIDEGFYLSLEYDGEFGSVEFVIETGWTLRGVITPPRPAYIQAWNDKGYVKLPIPHQALEDVLVRALGDDLNEIKQFLITVHDDYLQKGRTNDVVPKSSAD